MGRVAHHAELPITPVEDDGWDNRTFRLGAEMTVRLPSGDRYALQVDKEQRLGDEIDGDAARRVWDDALAAGWDGEPVWFHGDVAEGNLLLRDGRLAAVIDFGTSGVGDPACDAVIAWTLLSGPSRDAFRAALGVDPGTWSRGRGWGLWKALITLAGELERDPGGGAVQRRVIDRVLADHAREA